MPRRRAADPDRPVCNLERVHREWKESAAVRLVSVRRDRLFESSNCKPGVGDDPTCATIKFCIKDAVHNQFVLIPLLRRMASDGKHPLPPLKDLARENLDLYFNFRNCFTLKLTFHSRSTWLQSFCKLLLK